MSELIVRSALLPPNQTRLEAALANAAQWPLTPETIATLWDAATCPPSLLPWLAWALSVDDWDSQWPDERKRNAVLQSIALHRKKGTPWAVQRALQVHGYPDCELIEFADFRRSWAAAAGLQMDGSITHDGTRTMNAPGWLKYVALNHWAEYAIRINTVGEAWGPDAQRKVATLARRYAPARAHLVALIAMLLVRFCAQMRLRARRQVLRLHFTRCTRLSATKRLHMDGCWLMDGEYITTLMDGANAMDGTRAMASVLTGTAFSKGHLHLRPCVRMRMNMNAGGPRHRLDPMTGTEPNTGRPALEDGTRTMGYIGKAHGLWMHGRMTLRTPEGTTALPL